MTARGRPVTAALLRHGCVRPENSDAEIHAGLFLMPDYEDADSRRKHASELFFPPPKHVRPSGPAPACAHSRWPSQRPMRRPRGRVTACRAACMACAATAADARHRERKRIRAAWRAHGVRASSRMLHRCAPRICERVRKLKLFTRQSVYDWIFGHRGTHPSVWMRRSE